MKTNVAAIAGVVLVILFLTVRTFTPDKTAAQYIVSKYGPDLRYAANFYGVPFDIMASIMAVE